MRNDNQHPAGEIETAMIGPEYEALIPRIPMSGAGAGESEKRRAALVLAPLGIRC